jgi:hypothetical protein
VERCTATSISPGKSPPLRLRASNTAISVPRGVVASPGIRYVSTPSSPRRLTVVRNIRGSSGRVSRCGCSVAGRSEGWPHFAASQSTARRHSSADNARGYTSTSAISQLSPSAVATLAPRIRPPSGVPPAGNTNAVALHTPSADPDTDSAAGCTVGPNRPCSQRTGTEPCRVLPSNNTPAPAAGSRANNTTVRASRSVPHEPAACHNAAEPLNRTTSDRPNAACTCTSCGRPKTRFSDLAGCSPAAEFQPVTSAPADCKPPSRYHAYSGPFGGSAAAQRTPYAAFSTDTTARQTDTIRSTDRWYMQKNPG